MNNQLNTSFLATRSNLTELNLSLGEKAEIMEIFKRMQSISQHQFSEIDDVVIVLNELKSKIQLNPSLIDKVRSITYPKALEPLNRLLDDASFMFKRGSQGNRFHEDLKKICIFLFIQGGLSLYNSISAIASIPSSSEIRRAMYDFYPYVSLGQIYAKELKAFLVSRNLELAVGISEDATRVRSHLMYDVQTSSLIGLNPPINSDTGFPNVSEFVIKKPSDVLKLIQKYPRALFLEVIMATPFEKSKRKLF